MHPCESLEARLLLAAVLAEDLAAPTPQTTGPYIVGIYSSRQLDASASTDPEPGESLSFAWDLDNDNVFGETAAAAANGDEIGPMPTFFANATPIGMYPIRLKVTDSSGLSSDLTTSITIRDYLLNGTPGNDSWRISMNPSNIVDFYENAPADAPPTFSIPFNKIIMIRVVAGDGDDTVTMNYPFPCNLQFGEGNDTYVMTGGVGWTDVPQSSLENLVVSGTASFDLRRISYQFSSLTLSGSAKVSLTGTNTFLHVGSLSMTDSATLDLTHNKLIVDSGDIYQISTYINAGRIQPDWNLETGNQFMAAIINTNPMRTSFAGETGLVGGEVLVQRAVYGDLNFDGHVTIADFIELASHFNRSPAIWADGDTNRDGIVSIADFINLAIVFTANVPTSAPAQPTLSSVITSASPTKHRRHKSHHYRKPVQKFPLPQAYWLENR